MKKQLGMTTAMAAALLALPACSSSDDWNEDVIADRDTAICVNPDGERVDDDLCDDDDYRGSFVRYYFARRAPVPYYGDSIHHSRYKGYGSYRPAPGVEYARAPVSTSITRSQAVSRGGLGSSSRRYGGGWS